MQKLMFRKKRAESSDRKKVQSGFTLIEVTIVLGLTGLLLIGILGGTQSSIRNQRYNDSVRSFAEHLRTIYSEVINPQSLGFGNATNYAVLGKIVVFGHDYDNTNDRRAIYDATLVGRVDLQDTSTGDFISELANSDINIYCGQEINGASGATTVSRYEPLWQAEINYANQNNIFAGQRTALDQPLTPIDTESKDLFSGTIIVARSPKSGGIHTIFTQETYDLRDDCQSKDKSAASTRLRTDLQDFVSGSGTDTPEFGYAELGFCVESENAPGGMREVRLAYDGRNTSAVSLIDVDSEDNKCQD